MSELLAIGISHKTAPVALRERLAMVEGKATSVLRDLHSHDEISEAVAISTCNRTELYFFVTDSVQAENLALSELTRHAGIRPTELLERLYSLRGSEVVSHLFRVAAGLDSMIVGENEVQGQVKRAYELARVEGFTGPVTNKLFRDALAAGKRIRTETAVGSLRISISSVAVGLARGAVGDLSDQHTLVLGAGGNGEIIAKALSEEGVNTVFVANRRHDRAIGLAERFGGQAVRFEELPEQLLDTDIVLSSTASPHQIIGAEEVGIVMEQRKGRPLLLIDLAVPRDVDAAAGEIPGVTLFNMDDIQRMVARNISVRHSEATRAEAIVHQELEKFEQWFTALDIVPTITALRQRGAQIASQVVAENRNRFESLSETDHERVEMLAQAIVGRMLHEPTLRLKDADDEKLYPYVQALRELFSLDPAVLAPRDEAISRVDELADVKRRRGQSRKV